jgi:hypothetical protein
MVKVCSFNYPKSNESEYKEYYNKYSYELHDFQKWSIQGIIEGNHLLVCAPTGSGKTMPSEFALEYFHYKGKKTIYTSPIKALSNEKFYNFTQKYPHISIGLITGDIKTNPDADVLIMTTEILLNKLYQIKSTTPVTASSISFEMNIENDLGCVVFDEIHMINDESRGHVWEQCIMLLPEQVQMIGLSATLDDPERFAYWLETKGDINKTITKTVYLTKKQERIVPLIHYSFITTTNGINKAIKDKSIQDEIKKIINKPFVIQDDKGKFNEQTYLTTMKMLKLFEKHDVRVKRQHVLNKVAEYLVENEMLPALCYVFSRKQLEKCAQELTTNLLEFDSKVPYTVDRECEQIIRKLPNYEEYLHLPEYLNVIKLLRKGVGIHHAGLMPILREMTEMLFARGFIKILFCTETMSVGINLPVKTTIFTDVNKFNGEINRMLYSHEYTQSAGRAGRLGLDKVGHVIHLNNLFKNIDSVNYKLMMSGKPQTLISKFKFSYNLLLNLINIGDVNFINFAEKSMVTNEVDEQIKQVYYKITTLEGEIEIANEYILNLRTPRNIIEQYNDLVSKKHLSVNKKRKEIERQIQQIIDNYKFLESDRLSVNKITSKQNELIILKDQMTKLSNYIKSGVDKIVMILRENGFLDDSYSDSQKIKLTSQGIIATNLSEIHCLVFAKLLEDKEIDKLNVKQIIALLSCFTNIKVQEQFKNHKPNVDDKELVSIIQIIETSYKEYQKIELENYVNTGIDYTIHYDLINYILEWCDTTNVDECKLILQTMNQEKEIFLGEFVKALLKINNISNELEKIADMTGNMNLLSKLREIQMMTLKYVVTNQSLYV